MLHQGAQEHRSAFFVLGFLTCQASPCCELTFDLFEPVDNDFQLDGPDGLNTL